MTSKPVLVGKVQIGGGAPVVVQSMTKCPSENLNAVINEINALAKAGCEIVRVAMPNQQSVANIPKIKEKTKLPIVADIHFDYKLAIASIKAGADKIRINPGNIGAEYKVREIIKTAKDYQVPIRIGVNAGSIAQSILKKYQKPNTQAILASIEQSLRVFEKADFTNIVLSAKTTNPKETIEIYQHLSANYPYPLHLGVTEAGLPFEGAIRSTTALAILLHQGIGDTIRISLTGPSILEVKAAQALLASLGLRRFGPELISCPTCGRCQVNLQKIAQQVEKALVNINQPIKVAVMGCVVNGPGEAKNADFGIACGKKAGVIFQSGKIIKKVSEDKLVSELIKVISG